MGKIHTLDPHIVSKIAAGEVIERPVYAVKELVENAIDAGATSITITIEESGLKKIVVSDNGEGMGQDDLIEAFKPHTTSKINDQLVGIQTLGFRGEALASIASISELAIQSRQQNQPGGLRVVVKHGRLEKSGPIGMPKGTTVTVSNLFANVPARKKFLKTERIEFHAIASLITQYAISNSNIRFLLIHNKRKILDVPENQILQTKLEQLLGTTISSNLIPVQHDESYIQISGFIAHPQIATRNGSKQFIFVNNRIVESKSISQTVKSSFGQLLEHALYPVFILSLTVPYEIVDVNIHPRKEQVAFLNHEVILEEIVKAITKTLAQNNLIFRSKIFSTRRGSTSSFSSEQIKNSVKPWSIKDKNKILKGADIQQLHNLYLLVQSENGLMLLDQHASHERILYEQFLDEFKTQTKNHTLFDLEKPIVIEFSPSDHELFLEHINSIKKLGFEIEEFSKNSYRIDRIPELLKDRNIEQFIHELLELLSENKKDIDRISQNMIAFLACRSAIKAGEPLEKNEAKRLIEKLQSTKNNTTCPHGRPTMIEIKIEEMNRMFGRS